MLAKFLKPIFSLKLRKVLGGFFMGLFDIFSGEITTTSPTSNSSSTKSNLMGTDTEAGSKLGEKVGGFIGEKLGGESGRKIGEAIGGGLGWTVAK